MGWHIALDWVKQVKRRFRKEVENIEKLENHLFCTVKNTVKFLSGCEALGKWFTSGATHWYGNDSYRKTDDLENRSLLKNKINR